MTDSLVWQLIKNNNSFLVKRGGGGPRGGNSKRAGTVQFSCEPGNLLGVNSFKYSGLANSKAVNISKSGTELSLSTKAFKSANKCKKSLATIPLKKNTKHTLKVIKSRACSNFYRADLLSAATGKYKGLKNAVRVQKGIIKGARPQTSRDSR